MQIILFYFLIGLLNVCAEFLVNEPLKYASKVLLMPTLMLFVYRTIKATNVMRMIYAALFFSWLGDIFLMFPKTQTVISPKLLFLAGLISFLIAHIFYSLYFYYEIKGKNTASIIIKNPSLLLPFAIFVATLLYILFPTLDAMKVPVIIYTLVIITMAIMALNRHGFVESRSFVYVFIGACLFVFSDACIAINLFYKPFNLARLLIMSTYITAQFLIIKGVILSKQMKA